MRKLSETYKELGIAFSFPIRIKDAKGYETYDEYSDGYWWRREYDAKGNVTYFEDSNGTKGGTKRVSLAGKIIEIDGKKYQLKEL